MKYDETGTYELIYKATDSCGNETTQTRTVIVEVPGIITEFEYKVTDLPAEYEFTAVKPRHTGLVHLRIVGETVDGEPIDITSKYEFLSMEDGRQRGMGEGTLYGELYCDFNNREVVGGMFRGSWGLNEGTYMITLYAAL